MFKKVYFLLSKILSIIGVKVVGNKKVIFVIFCVFKNKIINNINKEIR